MTCDELAVIDSPKSAMPCIIFRHISLGICAGDSSSTGHLAFRELSSLTSFFPQLFTHFFFPPFEGTLSRDD